MKKFLLPMMVSALALSAATPVMAQAKEVKFGCYAPMTGQLAIFGKSMQTGIDMAIEDFSKRPEAKGITFRIACDDDQGRADDGINIARKLGDDRSVLAVIGSWSSTVTLAAAPLYNAAKLVNITPISSHPDVTKSGPYVFRQSLTQDLEGETTSRNLASLGAKRVALIGVPNDYGKANLMYARAGIEKNGGEIVFEEFVRQDAQDFRQTLQKAVRAKPDWLYLGTFVPQTALMLKQLRQMGVKTPVYLPANNDTPDLLRLGGNEATNGVHLTVAFNPAMGPEMSDFFQRYSAKFGRAPDTFAGNSYTTTMMMMEIAAKQYPNVTRESIKTGLDEIRDFKSVFGNLKYDPKTREWQYRLRHGRIEQGVTKMLD
ncbi:MAG: ABC transporter substrate-binding protein [Ottowia sp.]|uniref:ABC transporter substrate-binding protein n=1 Tax=Ottowia sp. TaxID=1898956 RepID=UPI0039E30E8B